MRGAQLGEQVVGEVGRVRAQRAGGGAGEDDRRLGEGETAAGGGVGGTGEVGQDAEAVHLADHLLAEPGQPRLTRPGGPGEREQPQSEGVQGAQDAEGVADRGGHRGSGDHGGTAAVAGVGELPGVVREPQPLGVGADHRTDQVELFEGGADGPLAGEGIGQVQRPELGADVARAQPGQIGAEGALAEFEVVPGQAPQHPGQPVVAVGHGMDGEEGPGPLQRTALPGALLGARLGAFPGAFLSAFPAAPGVLRGAGRGPFRAGQGCVEPAQSGGRVQLVLQVGHGGLPVS